MPSMSLRPITSRRGTLCEGPSWLPGVNAFQWVDIAEGRLCRWFEDTGEIVERAFEPPLGCALPLDSTAMVLASQGDLWIYDWDTEDRRHVVTLPLRPGTRLNDGGIDRDGAIWVGSMSEDGTPDAGALFRVTLDGRYDVVLPAVSNSNGIGWLADGRAVYVDSPTRRVQTIGSRHDGFPARPFANVDGPGIPDGLAVDEVGTVWVAVWDGARIARFDANGTFMPPCPVPVPRPTSLAFGGRNGNLMVVTTASWGMNADELAVAPLSGHVLMGEWPPIR